ncbi:chromate resistance protein ChrB domain-containing protein [Cupriavidus necator]|uniref:chromate resistance protein ChrB domain-containing protein n=1 Tax=Cupriavidus necator TaxID=106590 RepID=UPI00339D70F3
MTAFIDSWALLIVSLPTSGATARMRIWRTTKTLGCAALRDGAYMLPAGDEQIAELRELVDVTQQQDGEAWLLTVCSRNQAESATFRALFDRSADYAELQTTLSEARKTLSDLNGVDLNRLLRRHARTYEAIRKIDFFPNDASSRAEAQWTDFVRAIETLQSPDEPQALARTIARRDPARYQGRLWATRRHLWVDRLASAWLIRRFIDPHARFLWLKTPADCPDEALGFDFDGATFTHVGDRVSFEVLMASFGLESNRGLGRLGAMVHALDIGGISVPEASGFEAMLAGARARLANDDALLAEIGTVLDSLYTYFSANKEP